MAKTVTEILSVIIPAHNEAAMIDDCIASVVASGPVGVIEIIVVANNCQDDTVAKAESWRDAVEARGWRLDVLDLPQGGKPRALNAGDAVAQGSAKAGGRVYLDADVRVSPDLLGELTQVLARTDAVYSSGQMRIPIPASAVSRAYRRAYLRVPFMRHGVPGAGLFAMNGAGRARWGEWPDIISDDTYARLQFAPEERVAVAATYDWPIVEGLTNLVTVRRRQNTGVDQIAQLFPALLRNNDTSGLGLLGALKMALRDPAGFAAYAGVAAIVKFTKTRGGNDWSRGR